MKTIPFRLSDSEHAAFKAAAAAEGLSMQAILARSTAAVVSERIAHVRFAARAGRGDPAKAKTLLANIRQRVKQA